MQDQEHQANTKSGLLHNIILMVALLISIIAGYFFFFEQKAKKPLAGRVSESPVPIGGDFVLTDQDGNSFSSKKLKGHLSIIYFGFTYCPDICPTSLQKLTKVLEVLGKYNIEITPVFITIDPERDTVKVLKEYLGHFHPKFIGLTGTLEQIKDVAAKFKVYYAKTGGNHDTYMLDHSSFVYLMDKKGKYLQHFHLDTKPEEIIEVIRVNK